MTEDEIGHQWLEGHEFEQAPGVGDGQGSLVCYSPWGHRESDMTEELNWTPSSGDLPNPGIKQGSPALQADSLPAELRGSPLSISQFPRFLATHQNQELPGLEGESQLLVHQHISLRFSFLPSSLVYFGSSYTFIYLKKIFFSTVLAVYDVWIGLLQAIAIEPNVLSKYLLL